MVSTLTSQLSITKSRRDNSFSAVNICLKLSSFLEKKFSAILRMIATIKPIFGPFCKLFCFHLSSCLNQRANWNSFVMINDLAKNQLKLWLKIFDRFNSKPIWKAHMLKTLIHYDACGNGWGAWYVDKNNQTQSYCREFKSHHTHAFTSFTYRELFILLSFLELTKNSLANSTIVALGGSLNIFHILSFGRSKHLHLYNLCFEIFFLCLEHSIILEP